MELNGHATIELTGYEMGTLMGILRYILERKDLGKNEKYAKSVQEKLKKLSEQYD